MIKLLSSNWHGLGSEPPDFYGCDSRQQYLKNLEIQPPDWPWRTRRVRYTVNSQGYRCPEFTDIAWSESILVFGCSYIFAPGIDDSDTMCSLLESRVGLPVINLGQGATDDLFQWINTNILVAAGVQPRAVIYLWPGQHRLSELLGGGRVDNWGPWNAHLSPLAAGWITNETHGAEFLQYLSLSVRNLWSAPVLEFYPYMYRPERRGTILPWGNVRDAARDVGERGNYHPGPETQQYWLEDFLLPELTARKIIG